MLEYSLRNVDTIFIGTLKAPTKLETQHYNIDTAAFGQSLDVQVFRVMRGDIAGGTAKIVSMMTPSCDSKLFIPEYGKKYIFFANAQQNGAFTDYRLADYCGTEALEITLGEKIRIYKGYNAEKDIYDYQVMSVDEFEREYINPAVSQLIFD
ncbi:MAG: hypothetical protein COV36_05425 [Alphaproteobacteria bacterium CG11_big_fil_rev_8_21_14_0_20_44_7]|nr:MAG: hypothetical protein COV36_05425 [Alphaproteobacteria bacterium CG11_big_fil_rev_8_21_14_0_20_44_7]